MYKDPKYTDVSFLKSLEIGQPVHVWTLAHFGANWKHEYKYKVTRIMPTQIEVGRFKFYKKDGWQVGGSLMKISDSPRNWKALNKKDLQEY